MSRLSTNTLSTLPTTVSLPQYERENLSVGIVHLGIGAFHRAHQAYYTETLLNQDGNSENLSWGIIGCSLRSPTVREQMQAQDGLYTLIENSNEGSRYQIVGCIKGVLAAYDQRDEIIQAFSNPEVKIISLTVTEKGYCHDPATGNLNVEHPDIAHDLKNCDEPKSAIGFIIAAMLQRQQQGLPGFTLLSCDNLPSNGKVLEKVVKEFSRLVNPSLLSWIHANISFPSTMIDRIVPATTEDDKNQLEKHLGIRDEALVTTEPFTQWVIEDKFIRGRPAWEKAGATLVESVDAFEDIKLRLLNGSHSLIAYTGYLSQYKTVAEVMAAPAFRRMVIQFMETEATPTLFIPKDFDVRDYKKQLIERFSNRALQHKTWQIAMDGSQKIPQRWLNTLRHQIKTGGEITILVIGLAAWMRYVTKQDDGGEPIDVSDPWALKLKQIGDEAKNNFELVTKILAIDSIFSNDLLEKELIQRITSVLDTFSEQGVRKTIENLFT